MARGPNIDREKTKEAIIEEARYIINLEGLQGLSIRKIAGRIGCSIGTIYNVFKNLDDVILTINGLTLDDLYSQLQSAVAGGGPPKADLQKLARSYVTFSRERYHLWNTLFEHRLPEGSSLPNWLQQKIDKPFMLVTTSLVPLFSNRQEAERTAHILWAGLHGICSLSLSGKLKTVKAETAATLTTSYIDIFIEGLLSKEKSSGEKNNE